MFQAVLSDGAGRQAPALRRATDAIWRSRFWILGLALIGAIVGALMGERTSAGYQSTALLLAPPLERPVLGFDRATTGLSSELVVLDTSMQLMRSPAHLQAVAEELLTSGEAGELVRLIEADGDFADLFATSPSTAMREYIARNLTVRQEGRAEIISVSFLSGDPNVAALVANAVANNFLDNQAAERRAEAERIVEALAARVNALEEEVRRTSGLVQSSAAEADLVLPRASQEEMLSQMTLALLDAETERDTLDARLRELQDRTATGSTQGAVPAVRNSEGIVRQDAETPQADGSAILDPFRQEIARSEADLEAADIERRLDAASRRVEALQGTVAELREQLVTRARAESELDILQRNAAAVSETYSQMLKRLQEVSAEGAVIEPDLRVVSPAMPPRQAATAGTPLLATMGFMAFALLGLGAALLVAPARDDGPEEA